MTQKAAIVTGGAARIGRSIALRLARLGYDIVLHYNSSGEAARKTENEIKNLGVQCTRVQINMKEPGSGPALFSKIPASWNVKILVNNASIFQASDFQDEGEEKLDLHYKINFRSPYSLTKAFVRHSSQGHIINLLDTKVEENHTDHLDYLLTKKLLRDFTLIAARELGPDFRVNGIAPGLILPPEGKEKDYLMEKAEGIPLKTIGDLTQIENAVEFLIKNPFLTGQILYINGGEHL